MLVEKWNSGTNSWWIGEQCCGTVLVEQCGGKVRTVENGWWNSVVEQWNSDGGTVLVEQCG